MAFAFHTLMGQAVKIVWPFLFLISFALLAPNCMAEEQTPTYSVAPVNPRVEAPRGRTHQDLTIQRALDLLQQDVNPIKPVTFDEAKVIYSRLGTTPSKGMSAFRAPGDLLDPNIYINTDEKFYKDANRNKHLSGFPNVRLAGILLHEQVHNTERGEEGERAARRKEADFLRWHLNELKTIPRSQREAAKEHLRVLDWLAEGK